VVDGQFPDADAGLLKAGAADFVGAGEGAGIDDGEVAEAGVFIRRPWGRRSGSRGSGDSKPAPPTKMPAAMRASP